MKCFMEILINAEKNLNSIVCGCDDYNCGCDVKGSCNPDCPGYNPCNDCWVGG